MLRIEQLAISNKQLAKVPVSNSYFLVSMNYEGAEHE